MARPFDPVGPAVSLGDATSIFPNQLSREWSARGIPSVIVTSSTADVLPPEGVSLLRSQPFETAATRTLRRLLEPIARPLERALPRWQRARYARRTGRAQPEKWEWRWLDHLWESPSRARAALSQRPRFVFAHEASSYGLSAALCRGVPRVIFPWGGDVFNYVESSIALERMVTWALRHVDLIVPGSVVAARHICERFEVPEEKVKAVSWGVDLKRFAPAAPEFRSGFCRDLGIDPKSVLVLNSRRFRPFWGSTQVLEAFLRLARRMDGIHFLLLTGSGAEDDVRDARKRIDVEGMTARFTFFEGNLPLARCGEIMSVSDAFVSWTGRGDMRSASVIQAAACGSAPVILDAPEYREMTRLGFACEFVRPDDVGDLVAALERLVTDPARRHAVSARNRRYVAEHEDYDRQMQLLLDLIDEASQPYRTRS